MSDWTMEMIKKGYGLPPLSSEKIEFTMDKENNLLTAQDARILSIDGARNRNSNNLNNILIEIKNAAINGNTSYTCNYISDLNQEKLRELGYNINHYVSYFRGHVYEIKW